MTVAVSVVTLQQWLLVLFLAGKWNSLTLRSQWGYHV